MNSRMCLYFVERHAWRSELKVVASFLSKQTHYKFSFIHIYSNSICLVFSIVFIVFYICLGCVFLVFFFLLFLMYFDSKSSF